MPQLIDSLSHLPISSWQILFFLSAWIIIIFFLWTGWIAAKEGIDTVKRLHQIPCSDCQFFTGSYQLKCPVHPKSALTEEAINCSDYCQRGHRISYYSGSQLSTIQLKEDKQEQSRQKEYESLLDRPTTKNRRGV